MYVYVHGENYDIHTFFPTFLVKTISHHLRTFQFGGLVRPQTWQTSTFGGDETQVVDGFWGQSHLYTYSDYLRSVVLVHYLHRWMCLLAVVLTPGLKFTLVGSVEGAHQIVSLSAAKMIPHNDQQPMGLLIGLWNDINLAALYVLFHVCWHLWYVTITCWFQYVVDIPLVVNWYSFMIIYSFMARLAATASDSQRTKKSFVERWIRRFLDQWGNNMFIDIISKSKGCSSLMNPIGTMIFPA